ncbi:MBL fold metallo-hydrolase [Salinirubrum litoreum]|uniref:MBL fold metallo-hydrolase n=1 Tax=Salinirubrum litoreum TaxID=1126234 RepID=A0ABD5RFW1_9EURY|nr:MBL fold metallo-hydrolase [Salinirubrum litoreum]
MELASGVYGLTVESDFDGRTLEIHPVAVETPRGLLLLDVGLPECVPDLRAALDEEGLSLDDVWAVVVTHQDLDHAGCLAEVIEAVGVVVVTHEDEAPYLEGDRALVKSTDDRPMKLAPVIVDLQVVGGETFATSAGPMRVVETPGHAPGHTSYHFPDAELLVSADALNVVDGELVGPREDATPDLDTAWGSVGRLADLDFDETFCFHGGYVDAGSERVAELLAER